MAQSFAKTRIHARRLPMNRTEMRIGSNLDSPELDQRFEVVINRKGGEWRVSEVEVPELQRGHGRGHAAIPRRSGGAE